MIEILYQIFQNLTTPPKINIQYRLPQNIQKQQQTRIMAQTLITQNLYQLPSCTICLNELTSDLSSLACGHIFHIECITQHFEYKGTCPNCQKRAQLKIRLVVYPVVHNTKSGNYLRMLLEGMGRSEGQQVQGLLGEVKVLSQRVEKLENQVREYEKDIKRSGEENDRMKREIQQKTQELYILKKQMQKVKKQLRQKSQTLQLKIIQLIDTQQKYQTLRTQHKQLQHFRTVQKAAIQNSQQLLKYRHQLQSNQTAPEIICKQYFQMLQIKNLNMLRLKQKNKQYAEKYRYKEEQIVRLKNQILGLKKDVEEGLGEVAKWKARYEKVREKYRENVRKTVVDGDAEQLGENSVSVSLGMLPKGNKGIAIANTSEKQERQVMFNVVEKPKTVQQKISFGNFTLKKPAEQKKQITLKNFMK